ncbi:hypothetical protein M9458_055368, partial [Cirrhinus mrigala]
MYLQTVNPTSYCHLNAAVPILLLCCAVLHNLTLLNGDVVESEDEKDHEDAPLNPTTLKQEQENMCGTIWPSPCLLDYL